MIGMNCVILDNAIVGENSIIGANSLVKNDSEIAANSLALGSPAKVIRALSEKELKWKADGTAEYQMLARMYPSAMLETKAENQADWDRPRMNTSNYTHKPKTE